MNEFGSMLQGVRRGPFRGRPQQPARPPRSRMRHVGATPTTPRAILGDAARPSGTEKPSGSPGLSGQRSCAAYVKLKVASTGRNRPLAHPNPAIQPMFESSPHAGNLLCHTVFPSQCQPIVGSLKQTFYCFILAGQRKPRDGHREMKFAAMRLGCFLSRQ
jgi:hypothetical protein